VFVRAGEDAWYARRMEARVLGKAAGPITTDRLNLFIQRSREYYPFKVCALEPVENDTYVGVDRATQTELDALQRQITWRVTGKTPDGRQLVARSVLFEACDDEELRGAALLVVDEVTNEIMMFHPLGTYGEGDNSYPAWVILPSPKRTDEVFGFSVVGQFEIGRPGKG
jgi:hypothetical protein